MLTLDHVFVLTGEGAPIGDKLLELGMRESFSRRHAGQGTQNRRFCVEDGRMLELLWIADQDEAADGTAKRLRFLQRAQDPNASPFGLVFGAQGRQGDRETVFPAWIYQPDYFPVGTNFLVGQNADNLSEPLLIQSPFDSERRIVESDQLFSRLSHIEITIKGSALSPYIRQFPFPDDVKTNAGDEALLTLTFDQNRLGKTLDLRPALPMVLHW